MSIKKSSSRTATPRPGGHKKPHPFLPPNRELATFTLTTEARARLRRLAAERGLSMSRIVERLILDAPEGT